MDIDDSYKDFYAGPESDHFKDNLFYNPWAPRPEKSFWDMIRWRFNGLKAEWPQWVKNAPRPEIAPRSEVLKVTYIGHATMLAQVSNLNILIDPVFSERCSPFQSIGPKRVRAPFIPLEKLPEIDFVFVSHNHYDHLDQASLSWLARNRKPVFITPLGNTRLIVPCGDGCRVIALDWHQSTPLSSDMSLHVTPAQHWSRRGWTDINRDLWGGFFLDGSAGKKLFYCADSGFHGGLFQSIADRHGAPDIALLPLGAYEPRWFMKYSHMNPEEAVKIHVLMRAKKSMGFHFETFQLTDEAIDAPRQALAASLTKAKIAATDFIAPYPGDSVSV